MEKVSTISIQNISNDERSSLHNLIERISQELELFHQSVEFAKNSTYKDEKVKFFAEELLNKYSSSAIQILNDSSLSMERSLWIYADKLIDLSKYEEELSAYSITSSVAEFEVVKKNYAVIIRNAVIDFVAEAFSLINKAMKSYEFYLKDILVRNFNWNSKNGTFSVQLELLIDVM